MKMASPEWVKASKELTEALWKHVTKKVAADYGKLTKRESRLLRLGFDLYPLLQTLVVDDLLTKHGTAIEKEWVRQSNRRADELFDAASLENLP